MAKKGIKDISSTDQDSGMSDNLQKILVENSISLQHVLVDLSTRLDNLSQQISKLLELFEESAKTMIEKDIKLGEGDGNKDISDKLDKLLEQNKILARGLTLLHETSSTPQDGYQPQQQQQMQQPPQFPQQNIRDSGVNVNRYQRSISSGP